MDEAVSAVLGTCVSLGLLVESKDPREVIREVEEGKFKDLISKGVEKPSQEKLDSLAKEFSKIQKVQEAYIKELEAKKEAKAAVAAGAAPAEGAVPAAAAAPVAAAKPEAKKDAKKK